MSFQCEESSDCVANSTITKQCYEENNFRSDILFCDCSSWYGWSGENCDVATSTIYFSRFSFFVLASWSLFNILTLSKTLYLFFKYSFDVKKVLSSNYILYVIIFDLLSSCSIFLLKVLEAPATFDSTRFAVSEDPDIISRGADIEIRNVSDLTTGLLILGVLLHVFASTVIILSWLQVFNSMSKIINPGDELISEKTIQRIIISIITAFTVTFVLMSSIRAARNGVFFLVPTACVLLAISYLVGYFRFRHKMNFFLSGNLGTGEKKALEVVKRSCQVKVVCLISLLVAVSIGNSGLEAHLKVLKIGSFNYFLFFIDIAFAFGTFSITHTSYYVYKINKRLINRKTNFEDSWVPLPFTSSCASTSTAMKHTSKNLKTPKI